MPADEVDDDPARRVRPGHRVGAPPGLGRPVVEAAEQPVVAGTAEQDVADEEGAGDVAAQAVGVAAERVVAAAAVELVGVGAATDQVVAAAAVDDVVAGPGRR